MSWKNLVFVLVGGLALAFVPRAEAGDLRIPLPGRSKVTPVQRLNRDGVEAVRKHQLDRAKTLFYRAYLFDPDDPFTLNNLGYIAELEGQIERAQRFYALAAQHPTEAVVDRASTERAEGKPLRAAIRLLSANRAVEAENLLQPMLAVAPTNAFTLNNMGVAKEMQGDVEGALKYYTAAAATHSANPVVVTMSGAWRGKPVSEMAADSARKLRERAQSQESAEARAARLNMRGVSALNRNDWKDARECFRQANVLDPSNAFSLNNLGYLAEMDGDLETAQFYYEKARAGERANALVGLATRRSAEGKRLLEVAQDSDQKVEAGIERAQEVRRQQTGPIELKRRYNQPAADAPTPTPAEAPQASPQTPQSLGPPQPPIPQLSPAGEAPAPPSPPEPNQPPQ